MKREASTLRALSREPVWEFETLKKSTDMIGAEWVRQSDRSQVWTGRQEQSPWALQAELKRLSFILSGF